MWDLSPGRFGIPNKINYWLLSSRARSVLVGCLTSVSPPPEPETDKTPFRPEPEIDWALSHVVRCSYRAKIKQHKQKTQFWAWCSISLDDCRECAQNEAISSNSTWELKLALTLIPSPKAANMLSQDWPTSLASALKWVLGLGPAKDGAWHSSSLTW